MGPKETLNVDKLSGFTIEDILKILIIQIMISITRYLKRKKEKK